jgi:hypothetical protein
MTVAAGGPMRFGSRQFRALSASAQESTFCDKALGRFRPGGALFAASPSWPVKSALQLQLT